jgi:hypothetical protein
LVEGLLFGGERGERAAGYLSEANSILERDQDPETGRPAPEREMRFVFAVENALSRASKEEILRRLCNSGCCQKVKMIIEVGADKNGDLNRKVAKEWRLKYNGKTIVEYECFSKRERERYESEMKAFERGERRNRVLPMRRGN